MKMEKMFNGSVTSPSQSKTLLEYLPSETADLHFRVAATDWGGESFDLRFEPYRGVGGLPCWSLGVLMALLPNPLIVKSTSGVEQLFYPILEGMGRDFQMKYMSDNDDVLFETNTLRLMDAVITALIRCIVSWGYRIKGDEDKFSKRYLDFDSYSKLIGEFKEFKL